MGDSELLHWRLSSVSMILPLYILEILSVSYSFRLENVVQLPTVRTVTSVQMSFRFEAARVWNGLPRKVTEFKEFEKLIRIWTGPDCNCAICRS